MVPACFWLQRLFNLCAFTLTFCEPKIPLKLGFTYKISQISLVISQTLCYENRPCLATHIVWDSSVPADAVVIL